MHARSIAAFALGALFVLAGINHFWHPSFYDRMIPQWMPAPELLVAISGACEILGGLGVLVPATRRVAGIALIALLVAVFPANVQMAMHPELYRDIGSEPAFLIRLPLQLLAIAWVWWACGLSVRPASSATP